MTTGQTLVLIFVLVGANPADIPAQPPAASTRAFQKIQDRFGPEAEQRFVRAYRHLDQREFRQLSTEFLQNREKELRRFLARFPLAREAHQARILLAHTLLYREAHEEAESLLKMVILITDDPELESRARFTLVKLYRKTDALKARVVLREMIDSPMEEEARARACFELASLLKPQEAIPVLRQGGALKDGRYQRRCRLRLARLTLRDQGLLVPGRSSQMFRIRAVGGQVLSHKDLQDQVYLIYFWTQKNPRADEIRSYLGTLAQNHGEEGLQIIGVNLDGDSKILGQQASAGHYPWIEVGDHWGKLNELALRYAPDPAPFCVLVDRHGVIRYQGDIPVPASAAQFAETTLWKNVILALRTSLRSTEVFPTGAPRTIGPENS